MNDNLNRALDIARLALQFARVERVTKHEDGVRPETDSDHTVMLGLIACDLAPLGMRVGRIAEFSFVHDLLEAETLDVQTLTITDEGRAQKKERERVALRNFLERFGADTWLGGTLLAYEEQREPEAQFVRLIDKVLPKLTHLLNGCVAAKALTDEAGFRRSHDAQYATFHDAHGGVLGFRDALALLLASMEAAEDAWGDEPPLTEEDYQEFLQREREHRDGGVTLAAEMRRATDEPTQSTVDTPTPPQR